MGEKRKSPAPGGGAPEDGSGEERPTLVPKFDPQDFARDSELRRRAALVADGESTVEQARRLHAAGDDEEALFLLTRMLEVTPLHPEAKELSAECSRSLERQCLTAIGSLRAVLVVAVSTEELKRFPLDNVSGFLLSLLDGATDVEAVLDLCGLPRLLALRHLRGLLDRGIVAPGSRARPR